MKPSAASVGTQTISFGEVMDLLEETQAELKKLKATLQKKEFILENICDDGKMKALTSFTREEFFEWYKFLKIEKPLSLGSKKRPIDKFYMFIIKLRTGISNEFLSVLFDISDSTVSRDFNYVSKSGLQIVEIQTSSEAVLQLNSASEKGNVLLKKIKLIYSVYGHSVWRESDLRKQCCD
ncbi:uncharacterized protein TNCV_1852091 [Trichonephila clavipes]|nr:uncharacterized protein TNCV_1852091 [Trichonephila clavipes]